MGLNLLNIGVWFWSSQELCRNLSQVSDPSRIQAWCLLRLSQILCSPGWGVTLTAHPLLVPRSKIE